MFRPLYPARAAAPVPDSHPGMEMAAAVVITGEMGRGPVRDRDKVAQVREAVVLEPEPATAAITGAGNQPRAVPLAHRVKPGWLSESMRRYFPPA